MTANTKAFLVNLCTLGVVVACLTTTPPSKFGGKVYLDKSADTDQVRKVLPGALAEAKKIYREARKKEPKLTRKLVLSYRDVADKTSFGAIEEEGKNAISVTLFKLDGNLKGRLTHEFLHALGVHGHPEEFDSYGLWWEASRKAQPYLER